MSGAVMIVAMRLRDDGMVRVAMMPGTAHANELSIATNARPSSPVAAMIRSMRNAARDKYPTFSSSDRTRNSSSDHDQRTSSRSRTAKPNDSSMTRTKKTFSTHARPRWRPLRSILSGWR